VNDDIELMQRVRRATRTVSDLFHLPKGLGHAYDHSDLQTVIEERNIVLGRHTSRGGVAKRISRIFLGRPTTPKASGPKKRYGRSEGREERSDDRIQNNTLTHNLLLTASEMGWTCSARKRRRNMREKRWRKGRRRRSGAEESLEASFCLVG